MARASHRDKILDAGMAVLHERGFSASGVREITEAAGVPLGSFTNHFRSKEAFAVLVLERYMDVLLAIVARTLGDEDRAPLDRIAGYCDAIAAIAEPLEWRFGCLLANLGLELPAHSEAVRNALSQALGALTHPFVEAITDAQARGQARSDIGADDLAMAILAGWHGSLLRAKIEQRGDAPRRFAELVPLLLQGGA